MCIWQLFDFLKKLEYNCTVINCPIDQHFSNQTSNSSIAQYQTPKNLEQKDPLVSTIDEIGKNRNWRQPFLLKLNLGLVGHTIFHNIDMFR